MACAPFNTSMLRTSSGNLHLMVLTVIWRMSRDWRFRSLVRLLLTFCLVTAFVQVVSAQDVVRNSDLKPGARLILKFPELPQSLYAMQSGKEATTQLYVALPENYSPDRKYPLFVFLYGGHGGPGAGPGRRGNWAHGKRKGKRKRQGCKIILPFI